MLIPSYTDLLRQIDPSKNDSGKMTKLNQFESNRMFVDYYLLEPGMEQKPHTHADNDKLYFVLEGKGLFLLGDEEHEIDAGRGCVAEAGVLHGVRNHTAARLVVLVAMAPNPGKGPGKG
jgi:mannose-6-phosphate isomerase-like protein (cupin superfamily)